MKDVIGYRPCPDCGTRATVHWAGGRRQSLYQRCECDCMQHGGLFQSRLWYETEWLDGLKPESPPKKVVSEEEYVALLKKSHDRDQGFISGLIDRLDLGSTGPAENPDIPVETETETETETDSKPEKKRGKAGPIIGISLFISALVAFSVKAAKSSGG